MVVCDSIWKDPYTGKHTLIGTFSAIEGPDFPLVYSAFSVYVSLTDGDGKTSIRLELVDVDEECEPIFEMQADVEFPGQRAIAELRFQAARIPFPAPGEYRLMLFAGEEFVTERRILALLRPEIRGDNESHNRS
jgi:hypothetical protein